MGRSLAALALIMLLAACDGGPQCAPDRAEKAGRAYAECLKGSEGVGEFLRVAGRYCGEVAFNAACRGLSERAASTRNEAR